RRCEGIPAELGAYSRLRADTIRVAPDHQHGPRHHHTGAAPPHTSQRRVSFERARVATAYVLRIGQRRSVRAEQFRQLSEVCVRRRLYRQGPPSSRISIRRAAVASIVRRSAGLQRQQLSPRPQVQLQAGIDSRTGRSRVSLGKATPGYLSVDYDWDNCPVRHRDERATVLDSPSNSEYGRADTGTLFAPFVSR